MPVATPTSDFIDTLRYGAYIVQARLTLFPGGAPSTVTVGGGANSLIVPVSVVSITADRNSEIRRSGSITAELTPTDTLWPTSPSSSLAPFGNEIFIEIGIGTADSSAPPQPGIPAGGVSVAQWMPLGLYDIATTTLDDTTVDVVLTLDVYDRSWTISQRQFLATYNFPATPSGNFVAEIEYLLNQVWGAAADAPPLTYNIVPTALTVPTASYNQGSDPWQAALDMATSVGYELYFDVTGAVVGHPIPNPTTQPVVWNFTNSDIAVYGEGGSLGGGGSSTLLGSVYSTPVGIQVQMTRDGIYNDIFITGTGTPNATYSTTGTAAPVIGEAADTNPNSPTYVNGPMGNIPEFVSTNLVSTSAQALTMAQNDLQAALSSAWTVTLTCNENPMFDIDDVVTVTDPNVGFTNPVTMVIDTISHVANYADTMSITGRVVPL